jgi:hypothetical protein
MLNALRIEKIINKGSVCFFCDEPFKECDTIIPGVGLIIGCVDIKKYKNHYWHKGCIGDYKKELRFNKKKNSCLN